MAGIPTSSEPLDAVRSLAEAAANQRGTTFVGCELRLFAAGAQTRAHDINSPISPFALGRAYELLLAPSTRRKSGAHLTPEAVARRLVAMMPPPDIADRILDPAAGGAAFLLAAADQLVEAGAVAGEVLGQLAGLDIDAGAIAVAEAALAVWGLDHGISPGPLPSLQQGDGLLDELPPAERVVGNPPFLTQLRASSSHTAARRVALRDRWGDLVGTYTDDAWLFLAAGLDTLTLGGVLAMVQPVSILAARHGQAVRAYVNECAEMTGLWVGRDQVFDASVQVCGIVARRDGSDTRRAGVDRAVGADFEPVAALHAQPAVDEWGSAAATALAVPRVRLAKAGRTVADLATATAGFRDQFYGFVPYVAETEAEPTRAYPPFVTVGMIDVLGLSWGDRSFKFAKRSFDRPVVDLEALRVGDPALAEWVAARSRPKLLMATQTRVVEVWVDRVGTAVPATPVLSIEPREQDDELLWMLAAALTAPAISAHFLAAKFGTAMSLNAMKLAARDVLAMPLPVDDDAWQAAAALLRSDPNDLEQFADLMGAAYQVTDLAVSQWWLNRLPNRTDAPHPSI